MFALAVPTSNAQQGKVTCLAPQTIINKHYLKRIPNKDDCRILFGKEPDFYISVPCGQCFLCKRKYQANWRIRLNHEYQYGNHDLRRSWFVTFTVSEEFYQLALHKPSVMIRSFLERYRELTRQKYGKKNGKSLFHWIVSERGEERGRLHFHGILFDSLLFKYQVESCWKYGFVSFKKLTIKRCGYVTKYITKGMSPGACQESIEHKPRVWCSAGIGKCYTQLDSAIRLAKGSGVYVPFIVKNNYVYAMPRYYKSKIFSESELGILKAQSLSTIYTTVVPPFSYAGLQFSSIENLLDALEKDVRYYAPKVKAFEPMPENTQFNNQFNRKFSRYE